MGCGFLSLYLSSCQNVSPGDNVRFWNWERFSARVTRNSERLGPPSFHTPVSRRVWDSVLASIVSGQARMFVFCIEFSVNT